ncbi:MAG TPA: YHYH domain-containing protein [Cellvibrio sp.]|nr:YHYH domain-containing protein [Cellvibrio sp.]
MEINKPLLFCLLLIPSLVLAHGGRTNKYGCHNDRKHGGYHCHNSGAVSQSQSFRASNNSENGFNSLNKKSANSQVRATNLAAYKKVVFEIQSVPNKLGYNAGKPDGLGKQAVKAIQHFQVDNEMTMDGSCRRFFR